MSKQKSDTYEYVYNSLNEFRKKLIELSMMDLSKLHIGVEWSWMPYAKDHIDFLIEQTEGVVQNLNDSPPPATKKIEELNQ
jgi:hypothetical protein